jgi:hypothetical protein
MRSFSLLFYQLRHTAGYIIALSNKLHRSQFPGIGIVGYLHGDHPLIAGVTKLSNDPVKVDLSIPRQQMMVAIQVVIVEVGVD